MELPPLVRQAEAQQKYGDDVIFIGVPSLTTNVNDMRQFVSDTGVRAFPHIADIDRDIWDRFEVEQQRTYVYLNDDGTWVQSGYGSLDADVEALVAR